MKNIKPSDCVNALLAVLSLITGCGLIGASDQYVLAFILIGVAVAIVLTMAIIKFVQYYRERKRRDINQTDMLAKAAVHCRSFKNLMTYTEKGLKRKYRRELSFTTKNVAALRAEGRKLRAAQKQITMENIEEVTLDTVKYADTGKKSVNTVAAKELISCAMDLDKIFLQVEMPELRYRVGKFIAEYAQKPLDRVKALIDFQGWSCILMGHYEKGERAIEEGLELLKNLGSEINEFDRLYYSARAYRHLAASPFERRKNIGAGKCDIPIGYLDSAKKYYDEMTAMELNPAQANKAASMEYGIRYGYAETYYDCAKARFPLSERHTYLEKAAKFIIELSKDEDLISTDKHRTVKVKILYNKIYFLAVALDCEGGEGYAAEMCACDRVDEDLAAVHKIISGSIYVDDGLESYIQQRVIQAYKKITSSDAFKPSLN